MNQSNSLHTTCQLTRVNSNFKDYIQRQLDEPWNKSTRHESWNDLALEMVGEGYSDDVIFQALRAWIPDDDKPDSELRRSIKGAHARNPKPATTSTRPRRDRSYSSDIEITGNKVTFTLSDKPEATEVPPGVPLRPIDFLKVAFQPGELICINNETTERGGKETLCGHGAFRTIEDWEARFEEYGHSMLDGSVGAYIRINPFKEGTKKGTDEHVSDFRNLLVEFDHRPKLEQWRIYKESGLPIRFVIDSGGDSLHAWIAVNASSLKEYEARQKRIYEYLSDYLDDKGNKNPSRFSRLPGVKRDEKGSEQLLIAQNIGASSWQEWEEENTDDGFPEFEDLADVFSEDVPEPKHVVQNCIRKGQVVILGGPAKTRKSWTMMELALAVSQGGNFLKWDCNHGKVCYVDTELEKFDLKQRFEKIAKARGFSLDPGEITKIRLRGKKTSIDDLVPMLTHRLKGKGYDLIIIDSIYLLLGHREENSNEQISDLGSWLHKLAVDLDAAIVFTHHFSKGSQIGKRGIEKFSGAGAWGRIVDSAIAMDGNPENDCFNFEPDFRTFAPQSPFVVQRNGPIWRIRTDVKVASKQSSTSANVDDILQILDGQTLAPGDWKEQACDTLKISARTFDSRKKKAEKDGLIEQSGNGRSTVCKLATNVAKNPDSGRYEVPKNTFAVEGMEQPF